MRQKGYVRLLTLLLALCLLLSPVVGTQASATGTAGDGAAEAQAASVQEAAQEAAASGGAGVSAQPLRFEEIGGEALDAGLYLEGTVEDAPEAVDLRAPYADTDRVRVMIVLEDAPVLEAGYSTTDLRESSAAQAYRKALVREQDSVASRIETQALDGDALEVCWNLTVGCNAISAYVRYGQIEAIEAVRGVSAVYIERTYELQEAQADGASPQMVGSNEMTDVYATWAAGYTGAGMRIAVIDTGVDTDHASFDPGALLYALEEAGGSYDLLDESDIAGVLTQLNAYTRSEGLTAADLYLNAKIPYTYSYIDCDTAVDHDSAGDHGSHVSGIAAANRYVPSGDGYAEQANKVAGAAPDAQLIEMQVFSDAGGAHGSDYIAAIEDALILGCDAVNLSLGTPATGHTSAGNAYFDSIFETLQGSDTVVVISAGNSFPWAAYGGSPTGLLYADDAGEATISDPGSYTNSLAVASVNNTMLTGNYITFAGKINAVYSETTGYGNDTFTTLDTSADGSGTTYGYVLIDGLGKEADYEGLDVAGKLVLVSRGETNFADKVNLAASKGAVGVVVYNNTSGAISMNLTGVAGRTPAVAITQAEAAAIRAASTAENGAYVGNAVVYAAIGSIQSEDGYTMSDFSSWGPTGALTIKPELSAIGGNVYSTRGDNTYGSLSGTSMSAPDVAGVTALVMQHIEEQGLADRTGLASRTLAQALLMGTATPLTDPASGAEYPVRQQGAGLVNAYGAVTTAAYAMVSGQDDGKVKAELGDDPDRTGAYSFTYTLHNLTDEAVAYELDASVLAPDVVLHEGVKYMSNAERALSPSVSFTSSAGQSYAYDVNGDGNVDRMDAAELLRYLAGKSALQVNEARYDLDRDGVLTTADVRIYLELLAGSSAHDVDLYRRVVTLPASGSATVTVSIRLSAADVAYITENFVNGTYIEGYAYAVSDENATLSIPFLAFYGNWTDPSMYEPVTYGDGAVTDKPSTYSMSLDDAERYGLNSLTVYSHYIEAEAPFPANHFAVDDEYLPERNALSSGSTLTGLTFSPIRNAAYDIFRLVDADTQEVYFEISEYAQLPAAFYNPTSGLWQNTLWVMDMFCPMLDKSGEALPEGTRLEAVFTTLPEYYLDESGALDTSKTPGKGADLSVTFTIDNTAPELTAATLHTDLMTGTHTLEVSLQDNFYAAAVVLLDSAGSQVLGRSALNQTEPGGTSTLSFEVSSDERGYTVALADYADNVSVYYIDLSEVGFGKAIFQPGGVYGLQRYNARSASDYYTIWHTWDQLDLSSFGTGGIVPYTVVADAPREYLAMDYCNGVVYAIGWDFEYYINHDTTVADAIESMDYTFCAIDAETLEETEIIRLPEGLVPVDMTYDYHSEKMYVLTMDLGIYTIDLANGDMVLQGTVVPLVGEDVMALGRPFGITADGKGNLYVAVQAGYKKIWYLYAFSLTDGKITDQRASEPINTGRASNFLGNIMYNYSTGTIFTATSGWNYNGGRVSNDMQEIAPDTLEVLAYGTAPVYWTALFMVPPDGSGGGEASDEPARVTLSDEALGLVAGQTAQLTAWVTPWTAADRSVTWSSSDDGIATVDANGLVTAVAGGAATVTATSTADPALSASCIVSVLDVDCDLLVLAHGKDSSKYWATYSISGGVTKLADCDLDIISAALYDDTIYALTSDSGLYKIDRRSLEATYVRTGAYAFGSNVPLTEITVSESGMLLGYGNGLYQFSMDRDFNVLNYYDLFDGYIWPDNMLALTAFKTTDLSTYTVMQYYMMDTSGQWYRGGACDRNVNGGADYSFYTYGMNMATPSGLYDHTLKSSNAAGTSMYFDRVTNTIYMSFTSNNVYPAHMELFQLDANGNFLSANSHVDLGRIDEDVLYFSAIMSYGYGKLTFDTRGGSAIEPVYVRYGESFTRPETDPTYEGWIFDGWYTDTACTEAYDFSAEVYVTNLTLYAKWLPDPDYRMVTFEYNYEGAPEPVRVMVSPGSTVAQPTDPSRIYYYIFQGWFTDAACTTAYDFTTPVNDDLTLYAGWKLRTYTVTFVANGGTFSNGQDTLEVEVEHGSTVTLPETPVRTGYELEGWYRNRELTWEFDFETRTITSDTSIYARWHELVPSVVYLDSGSGNDENDGTYYYPVKTFAKAKALLETVATTNTIYVKGYSVNGTEVWDLSDLDGAEINGYITVGAGSSLTLHGMTVKADLRSTMISVSSGALHTDETVTFDFENAAGNYSAVISIGLAYSATQDATLDLKGTTFKNITSTLISANYNLSNANVTVNLENCSVTGCSGTIVSAAGHDPLYTGSTTVNLKGCTITGNSPSNLFNFTGGNLNIETCTITGNTSRVFQLSYSYPITLNLYSGTITGNGDLFYTRQRSNGSGCPAIHIDPTASLTLEGPVDLNYSTGDSYIPVPLVLHKSLADSNITIVGDVLTIACTGVKEGSVLVQAGGDYALTDADLAKLKLDSTTLELALVDGQIIARAIAASQAVPGPSADPSEALAASSETLPAPSGDADIQPVIPVPSPMGTQTHLPV